MIEMISILNREKIDLSRSMSNEAAAIVAKDKDVLYF